MFAHCLTHEEILKAIQEQVRFARARMDTYELIDFVAVVIGYVVSGEPTLQAFYEHLAPFAEPFMALFECNQLPYRSTLSRFLAALDQPTLEVLRTLFQEDLPARNPFASPGGLFDRTRAQWTVVDVDGTRCVARQRALPQAESLPAPHRRFDHVCAPGYQGRKQGEVVRTRTIILQARSSLLKKSLIDEYISQQPYLLCSNGACQRKKDEMTWAFSTGWFVSCDKQILSKESESMQGSS